MTTRRAFFSALPVALPLFAVPVLNREIAMPGGDTWLILIPTDGWDFLVGVRTKVRADSALVTVMYEQPYTSAVGGKLLLSKQSVAPVAGETGHGATRDSFTMKLDSVRAIRVEFLAHVAEREVKL